jgi:hypothetical protein
MVSVGGLLVKEFPEFARHLLDAMPTFRARSDMARRKRTRAYAGEA